MRSRNSFAAWRHLCPRAPVPPLVLGDVAVLQLPHRRLEDLVGVVGKVQVSDLRQRDGDDGKGLLVLFGGAGADLSREQTKKKEFSK